MKKFLAVLLVLVMVLAVFAGCSSNDDVVEPEGGDAEGGSGSYRVASHNAEVEGNPYRVVYENQMHEAIEVYKGLGIVSEFATFVANNDPAAESQNIEKTINDGYDLILVNPIAATGLDPVIAKAVAAGVTYINADCVYESDDIVNVTVDQEEWARINVEYAVQVLGEGSKVVVFNGLDGNSASELRKNIYHEVLDANNVEIVWERAHNWDDTQAQQMMSQIISSGLEFDGIVNQEGAVGIFNAIQEANIDYPGVITSSEEVKWIRQIADLNKDELVFPFIIVENPPGIGATALAVGLNLLEGRTLNTAILDEWNNIKYAPQWIMTYENMADRLEEISDLPDSTSVSSYMMMEDAREAYFID